MTAQVPARSALFVPATRPERIAKALASGADAVIVDLEDAVHPSDKRVARENLRRFLDTQPQARLCVRINAADSADHEADLALCDHPGIATVMLPKAASRMAISRVAATGKPIWPIVETATGLVGLHALACAVGVERLVLGSLDLIHDLDLVPDQGPGARALEHARFDLAVHSRAAGLVPPLDGVFPVLDDKEGLAQAASHARAIGFGGLLCIHPCQVAAVNAAFTPTASEVEWAKRVLDAARSGQGVIVLDGQMVDAPVIARARRLLERAGT